MIADITYHIVAAGFYDKQTDVAAKAHFFFQRRSHKVLGPVDFGMLNSIGKILGLKYIILTGESSSGIRYDVDVQIIRDVNQRRDGYGIKDGKVQRDSAFSQFFPCGDWHTGTALPTARHLFESIAGKFPASDIHFGTKQAVRQSDTTTVETSA